MYKLSFRSKWWELQLSGDFVPSQKRTPSDNNALLAMRQKNGTIFKKFSESFPPHWTQRNGASDEFSLNDNGLIKWFYEHGLDQAAHQFSVDAILVLFVLYFGRF